MITVFKLIIYVSFITLVLGCGGSSGGGGYTGPPPMDQDPYDYDPGAPGGSLVPTFASIQENVFTPICTECHIGSMAPEGLMLNAGNSYGLLVGVESSQVPSLLRVEPNNPDDSYLIHKLEGTAEVGERMPLDHPPLGQATIDMIRQWISDGASLNGSASTMPVRASGASIVPNGLLQSLPDTIIVMFDRELDASSVQATAVSLMRSGGDGTFDDGNEVEVEIRSIGVPLTNLRSVTIVLGDAPDIEDVYRLALSGSPPSPIQDLAGNRLDGTRVHSFPSGDGTQGGDLEIEFTVTHPAD